MSCTVSSVWLIESLASVLVFSLMLGLLVLACSLASHNSRGFPFVPIERLLWLVAVVSLNFAMLSEQL